MRQSVDVWRLFGFVSDLNLMSREESKKLPKGAKTRNYHLQLDILLNGLSKIQHG